MVFKDIVFKFVQHSIISQTEDSERKCIDRKIQSKEGVEGEVNESI